jgi:hypothetical protein
VSLDWLLAFCAWLPMPFLAWFARRVQGRWTAPGAVVAGTWTIAAGVPLWLAPDLPVHPSAYAFVLAVVAVCVFASTVGASADLRAPAPSAPGAPMRWPALTWKLYYLGVALGCGAPILLYGDASTHTRAGDLAELAMYTSMGRYGGEYDVPMTVRLLAACTYVAAAIAGMVTAATPPAERNWRRSLAWALPLVATVAIHTEKAQMLYGIIMFSAGWAAGGGLSRTQFGGVRPTAILAVVGGVFVLVALFVGAQSMRMNRLSLGDIPFVLDHLRIYVVGHMPVFGHWWTVEFARSPGDGLGAHSFAGLAELAGLGVRQAGLYAGTSGFTESNIYTGLRPLLEDFGIVGALAFASVLSFAAGLGWRALQTGRRIGAAPVVAFTAYVLWSPITSIFVYSTIIATVLAVSAFAWWIDASLERRKI